MSFVVIRSCTPNSEVHMGLQYMHTMLYQTKTNVCLGPQLSNQISQVTLNDTRNVSNSTAVVQYAERPYMTCSFQVMHVRMYKWLVGKRLQCMLGAIIRLSYVASSSNINSAHLQEQSSHLICRTSVYNLQFSNYKCKYIQKVVSERGCNECLEP